MWECVNLIYAFEQSHIQAIKHSLITYQNETNISLFTQR